MGLDIYAAAKKFYEGMVRCALSTGATESNEDQHLDTAGYGESNLTTEARSYLMQEAYIVCSIAVNLGALDGESDFDLAGTDFWYTRNGHGAGYHERTELYGTHAITILEGIAGGFGEAELYEIGKGELDLACGLYVAGQPVKEVNTPLPDPQVTINDLWEELL